MVLGHELLHVRRGDLWLGWLPAAAQRVFYFHPLAALALREYVLAREAACDAEVLRLLDASPRAYGRLLLSLGVARGEIGAVAAETAPSLKALERRLGMLQLAPERARWRSMGWLVVGAALVGLVPMRVVARGPSRNDRSRIPAQGHALPRDRGPQDREKPPQAVRVPADTATGEVPSGTSTLTSDDTDTTTNTTTTTTSHTTSTVSSDVDLDRDDGHGDEDSVILTSGESICFMNGSIDDTDVAREIRRKVGSDVLLFRRGGELYVIRDAAILKRARTIVEPQMQLGAQQAELGARQAELGSRQADLGAQQAQLGREQAQLAAMQARLGAEQARRDLDGRGSSDLEAKISELGRRQTQLGDRQGELGEHQ